MTSLYDEYYAGASSSPSRRRVGNSPTRTSRMRASIIKLSCYLNGEADKARATIVHLPEECDTLGEIIPMIHARMGMDKRIAYAAELFLPDGKRIKTYQQLLDAADKSHAVIVGCGERFDPTSVPYHLLEAYLNGGGKEGLRKVKEQLQHKQKVAAQQKADTVRSQGHGIYPNSAAVVTARAEVVEAHKSVAAQMRHEYMEQLMFRAEQQKALQSIVQQNTAMQKEEHRASRERKAEMDAARMARITEEKQTDRGACPARGRARPRLRAPARACPRHTSPTRRDLITRSALTRAAVAVCGVVRSEIRGEAGGHARAHQGEARQHPSVRAGLVRRTLVMAGRPR